VTPVFYTYLDEWQQWFSRRKAKSAVGQGVVGAPEPAAGD
jgi:hypothetical protein